MTVPLVWVDFNAGGRWGSNPEYGIVYLTKRGTQRDLQRQQIQLVDGMRLRMFDCDLDENGHHDDIVAEGVVHFDKPRGEWYALFPVTGPTHVSDARKAPNHWAVDVDWPAVHHAVGFCMNSQPPSSAPA